MPIHLIALKFPTCGFALKAGGCPEQGTSRLLHAFAGNDDDDDDDDDLPDIQGVPLSCSGFIRRTNSRNREMALIFPCWYSQWGGSS